MKTKTIFTSALALALAFTATSPSHACTGITLKSKDGAVIFGRTMEWGSFDLHSRLVIVPRGHEYKSELPDGKQGLSWKTKYGAGGVDVVNKDLIVEAFEGQHAEAGVGHAPGC